MLSLRPSTAVRALLRQLRRIAADSRGNVAIVVAVGSTALVGAAAMTVETSYDYFRHVKLLSAADAAAFAGALQDRTGSGSSAVQAAASAAATADGWSSTGGAITVHVPPSSGGYAGNAQAVEVVLSQTVPRYFSAVLSAGDITVKARAVARFQTAANACVLALDKTASGAVSFQGSASASFTGCQVMSDSAASDAVNVQGSAHASADCVSASGGVQNNGGLTTTCAAPLTQQPRVADPFASLPTPAQGSLQTVHTGTLSPGYYPSGMSLGNGSYSLSPGVYYIGGSGLSTTGNAVVFGSGVTLYLAGGAAVSFNSNATISLSAPTSGTYSGVLFFGDRSASGVTNKFNGTASSSLTGDLYFPTQQVVYNGNFSGSGGCTQVVADTVVWSGNTSISVNCASAGMAAIPAQQPVSLVE
jgi:Flp pilus assembly protein TadG